MTLLGQAIGIGILLFVLVRFGQDLLAVLRTIATGLERDRIERSVAFSADEIVRARDGAIREDARAVMSDGELIERFGARNDLDEIERGEVERLMQISQSACGRSANYRKELDLMREANARVCAGVELASDARNRVVATVLRIGRDREDATPLDKALAASAGM